MSYITISPVCMSCQSSVGQFYEAYQTIRNLKIEKYLEETGYVPSDNAATESVNMSEFLDKVGIVNICCRQHMLGHNNVVQDSI